MRPFNLLTKHLITAIVLAAIVAAVTAVSLYSVYHNAVTELARTGVQAHREASIERFVSQAERVTEDLAAEVGATASRGAEDEVARLLAQSQRLNGALLVLLTDADARIVQYSGDPAVAGGDLTADAKLAELREDRLRVIVPVSHAGQPLGYLLQVFDTRTLLAATNTVQSSLAAIQEQFTRQSRARALLFGAFLILLVAGVVTAIAYRQTRSIRELVHGAKRLAEGDYETELTLRGSGEIGQLATAFDRMRDKLRGTTISRDYLDHVLGSMSDAIILVSPDGFITRVNHAATRLLDYAESDLLGMPFETLIPPGRQTAFRFGRELKRPEETVFIARGGRELPVSYTGSEIDADDPALKGFIIAARNITERKIAEQRIRYLARIDALTKVPNRMQFQHLLQRSIARARRGKHRLALLYVDIDRFKDINDTFGHTAGDTCLESLTDRLARLLPEGATIGRLAGDEFGVVIDSAQPTPEMRARMQSIARTILEELSRVLIVQGHEIYMTVSIGIACYPQDADNVIDLIRNADAALYHAKRAGGNRMEFYHPDMNAEAVERLMLKSKLRRSYELDELLLHYQPKIDLATGDVVGAEALVRWELSEHGMVLPSEFIPLAEETNLILEIGEWVLSQVCRDYRSWQKEIAAPGRVSVNLSLKQLVQRNFIKRVNRIFRRHSVSPACLELEITESTLMRDPAHTIRVLRELHEMGLHLAIDDFGTGYSSLSALQQFPISTLKIDKSFVRDAATDADDATIVATIVDMGHSLNMEVVAEGVENEGQLSFLRTLNCDYVQGLLFGDPMAADDYLDLLRTQRAGRNSYRALFAG